MRDCTSVRSAPIAIALDQVSMKRGDKAKHHLLASIAFLHRRELHLHPVDAIDAVYKKNDDEDEGNLRSVSDASA